MATREKLRFGCRICGVDLQCRDDTLQKHQASVGHQVRIGMVQEELLKTNGAAPAEIFMPLLHEMKAQMAGLRKEVAEMAVGLETNSRHTRQIHTSVGMLLSLHSPEARQKVGGPERSAKLAPVKPQGGGVTPHPLPQQKELAQPQQKVPTPLGVQTRQVEATPSAEINSTRIPEQHFSNSGS